jgi:hypothetical protein
VFSFSFCILASLRLGYRHTACLAVVSFALSLWALGQTYISYRWLGPPPQPEPKEFIAWLAAAAWACTLLGSHLRYWPFVLPAAIPCIYASSGPTLAALAGILTGMTLCLPIPQLPSWEPDEFGIRRT